MIVQKRVWARKSKKPGHHYGRIVSSILVAVLLTAGIANYARAIPVVAPMVRQPADIAAAPVSLAWPDFGQAALGMESRGVLATYGLQEPLATASIAKVITALCVLQKYPLTAGEQGPTVTMSARDVALYDDYVAKDGSVIPVEVGEQLTEYQLLEAIMLPSANNIADSTAVWAYGSVDAYLTFATQFLARNGLTETKVGVDASGLDGATTSTASDLVRLGLLALKEPALVEIMNKKSTDLPVIGTVYNYNSALGKSGIFGIKTGNNDYNLGALLFATKFEVAGKEQTVVGVVMGANSLRQAIDASVALAASVPANFVQTEALPAGASVATYSTPWGETPTLVTDEALRMVRWKGDAVHITIKAPALVRGQTRPVGSVSATLPGSAVTVQTRIAAPFAPPGFWWRLTRH